MLIDDMPACREMDLLIARHVMGWVEGRHFRIWNGNWIDRSGPLDGSHDDTGFRPSDDIAHAWEVVERMRHLGFETDTIRWVFSACLASRVSCFAAFTRYWPQGQRGRGLADTAPLAICRAALNAVPLPVENTAQSPAGSQPPGFRGPP